MNFWFLVDGFLHSWAFRFSLQIAFVFNLVCEDKSSVGCGEKIVLGGDEGLSLTAPTDQKLHFLFFYPLFFLLVPNILIPYFSVWKTERQATEGKTDDWLTGEEVWKTQSHIGYSLTMARRVFLKKQSSFLWPGHLNRAVSVYKEAKHQKSVFISKFDRVQHGVVIWGFYKGKSAKNEPKIWS